MRPLPLVAGLFLLLFFCMMAVSGARAQGGTPTPAPTPALTPTPTPVPWCPPSWQATCDYVVAVSQAYGFWFVGVVALALFGFWLFQRATKVADKFAEKKIEDLVKQKNADDPTTRYLQKFIEANKEFKFRGLETRARGIEPPELDQAFVSLRMTPEADERERGARLARTRKSADLTGFQNLSGLDAREPISLAQAIEHSFQLALVGAAGSGKSTLLQWAGLAMARARMDKRKLSDEQRTFVSAAAAAPLIPFLVPLRDFNRYCFDKKLNRTANTLLAFISYHIAEQHPSLDLSPDFCENHLRTTGCLLMFDGVDEVTPDDRKAVREAIEAVARDFQEKPSNRYLVTSRTVAYFGAAAVSGFRKCEVQSLTPDQRDQLIRSWCAVAYTSDEGTQQANDLCQRIASSDERVRALAVTPLMVTIFALVHYDRRELPRQRAELYEHAVRILLTEPYKPGEAAAQLRADWEPRRNRIAQIAFEMHAQKANDLSEDELIELCWRAFGNDEKTARQAAREFALRVADRGGLLEEENGRYGFFTHRTFREFLAGRYLAEEKSPNEQSAFLRICLGDDQWEEPVRLAVGYLAIGGERRAKEFLRSLLELSEGALDEQQAHALTLAGWSLYDLPLDRTYPDVQQPLAASSLQLLHANPPRISPALRRRLGLALGALGDPRFVPTTIQRDEQAVSFIPPALLTIPVSEFRMGTSDAEADLLKAQESESYDDEKPQHTVHVSEFDIGQYPVTNAEFRCFVVAAKGYERKEFWSDEGWRWRTDQLKEPDLSYISDKDTRQAYANWLKGRPKAKRHQPFYWDDPQWNAPNLPVVGVTWYEAEAYCQWLSMVTGEQFHLPKEAEWEKAARFSSPPFPPLLVREGQGVRLWPWGDTWDKDKCNSSESGFNSTTPVGLYPNGASPLGVADLVGNVWEWCLDGYNADLYKQREAAGQEIRDPKEPLTNALRVLRGGSWDHLPRDCRTALRNWDGATSFNSNVGLRVVRSPVRF
jgi:formylglycine-generating enzyme required for sulfatase activity